jgi:hypothetical protein
MAVIYPSWHKTVTTVCLTSLFSLALYGFSSLAKGQTIKSHKPQFSNPERNLLKCGWEKEINLKLPLWHLLSKNPEEEANRVEQAYRCGRSVPILLTALIPESNIGITIAKYPTFFFYIPDANLAGVKSASLFLYDHNQRVVYEKIVKLKSRDRIVSIALSDSPSLPPLEVGKSYKWDFYIAFDEGDMSRSVSVAGWIKRVSLDSKLQHKLNTALPQQKPAIYASNGLWYDALASLAKLRCSYPDHANFSSDWESLLQQVGLPEIAKKPLAQCN